MHLYVIKQVNCRLFTLVSTDTKNAKKNSPRNIGVN